MGKSGKAVGKQWQKAGLRRREAAVIQPQRGFLFFRVFRVFSGWSFSCRVAKGKTNHGTHGIHGNEVIDRFLFCVVRVFCGSFPYVHYTALCNPLCFCVFRGSISPQRLCKRMTNHGKHGIHGNEVIDRFLFCVVRVFRGSFPYVHYTALCKPFAAARQPLPAGPSRLFATALPLPFPPYTPPTAGTHPSGADPDSSAPYP